MTPDAANDAPDADDVVTLGDIEAARNRIAGSVHRTPLDTSRTFAEWSSAASVGLKLENMQRTGSFKIRGALNAIHQLSGTERDRGVITASAGNHAQGLALASRELGVDATIVVPEVTPAAKIAATRGYDAEVVVHGDIYEDAYEHAIERAAADDLTFVHPFDHDDVIAGQGTIGLELRDQYPELDTVLVAIGGGGLIAGIATALTAHDPEVRVLGVQPAGAAHAKSSLDRGEIHRLDDVDTIADGIADLRMLPRTFAVASERVDDVVTVPDDALTTAVTLLAERAKTVAEPAGAAPVAALLSDAVDVTDEHVACVVSGGNVDLTEFGALTSAGLERTGRRVNARLALADWPAALSSLTDVARDTGATLADVRREDRTAVDHPNRVPVRVTLEGSDAAHLASVLDTLDEHDAMTVVDAAPTSERLDATTGLPDDTIG